MYPNSAISACKPLFHRTNASAYLSSDLSPNMWHYSHPSMHSLTSVSFSSTQFILHLPMHGAIAHHTLNAFNQVTVAADCWLPSPEST